MVHTLIEETCNNPHEGVKSNIATFVELTPQIEDSVKTHEQPTLLLEGNSVTTVVQETILNEEAHELHPPTIVTNVELNRTQVSHDEEAQAKVLIYVDDTKVIKKIASIDDVESFQQELDSIYEWQESNNMMFNDSKFQLLRYGKDSRLKENTNYFTGNMELIIQESESCRDLGIRMEANGTFKEHIQNVNNKTRQKAGWVLRTFATRDKGLLKTLWKSLVQPLQDYCSQLWQPFLSQEVQSLEAPLRSYTRRMRGLHKMNYWERLYHLKMPSTQRRMDRYSIIYTWKCLSGLVPNCDLIEAPLSLRRGRMLKLPQMGPREGRYRTLRDHSFQTRAPRIWNSLPLVVRNCKSSLEEFKIMLDQFLMHVPDHPRVPGLTPEAIDIRGQQSNSISAWVRLLRLHDWTYTPEVALTDHHKTRPEGPRGATRDVPRDVLPEVSSGPGSTEEEPSLDEEEDERCSQ